MLSDIKQMMARRKEVWRLVPKSDRRYFSAALVVSVVFSTVTTAIPLVVGRLFQRVIDLKDHPATEIFQFSCIYLGILLALYVVRESLQTLRRYIINFTATRLEKQFTTRLVNHLLMVDLQALSRDRLGSLHGRISRAVEGFVKFLRITFIEFIPVVLTASFAVVTALWKDFRIGLIMAGVIPTAIFITVRQVKALKGIRMELVKAKEGLDGTVAEQLGGIEYIRAANTHAFEAQRIAAAAEARRAKELRYQVSLSRFDWCKAVNEGMFHVLVIGFSIYLAASGRLEYGAILTFSLLFTSIMGPLREVHRILDESYESSVQVSILMSLLKEPQDDSFGTVTQRQPALDRSVPLIAAHNLCIDYPGPGDKPHRVLDGIDVTIQHGETIGVAGPSGSGKSTWLRAVMRLIHPTRGAVVFGGVSIKVLSREDIGKLIGYVSQIPFVFTGTIAENIAYGVTNATTEGIEAAAKKAYIHDEIMLMPEGYQTILTERGGNLSGGQRQRIALARVFLRNPPVLILDEGTSALDNISERNVQLAINAVRGTRTIILVAHRLSTLRDVDRLYVFDKGKIVESGTYEELAAKGGLFTSLVTSAGGH
jgi:ATP-binding cassette subfamily B protein